MKWLRWLAVLFQVAIAGVAWLLFFNAIVVVTHANLGFCPNAAELMNPEPYCPAPWWFWVGNIAVPLILLGGAIRKIRQTSRDDQN